VQTLIAAYRLIAEKQPRHQASFFEPEDDAERARKEYTFNCGECNHAFGKAHGSSITSFERPSCFFPDAWDGLDGM
jgi:hypothetical protein